LKHFFAVLVCATVIASGANRLDELGTPEQAAINRISADSLRGNLSFLSSDALEGRGTPSKGLDIAAEFIASQFRRARLEPVGTDGSYFQAAKFVESTPKPESFHLTLKSGGQELELTQVDVRIRSVKALDFKDVAAITLPDNGTVPPIEGRIVVGAARRYGSESYLSLLESRKPALIVLVGKRRLTAGKSTFLEDIEKASVPVIRIGNEDAAAAVAARHEFVVSVQMKEPARKDVTLENVAGILRGSDPALRDQFVIVTAHYDHLGALDAVSGDRIYNGANDNGSGTVSVMEIAGALATLPTHPKRSILFMAFFGEEEGLLGSYYYVRHPLVPLKNTIANINLEQMGRTDEQDGAEIGAFAFTGPSYSDLPSFMKPAAKAEGVKTYAKHDGDQFFERSDNYAFALAGIVAHTVVVAFDYPDYHGLGDEWQKIDYANMAKVDRGVAAGIVALANSPSTPHWSDVQDTAQYREAGK
jgi:hypothetical protein